MSSPTYFAGEEKQNEAEWHSLLFAFELGPNGHGCLVQRIIKVVDKSETSWIDPGNFLFSS